MKGDFSRDTFDPRHHYTGVLMQQGRVHLDADVNEQGAIAQHYQRAMARDLIGPEGGPKNDEGFGIITDAAVAKNMGKRLEAGDFVIDTGRYYVNGLMCENTVPLLYSEQTGYPFDEATNIDTLAGIPSYLIYLDVWERHICAIEDPGIDEPALGGPDTSTRTQLTWQVRVLVGSPDGGAPTSPADHFARNGPLLAARAEPAATNNDPCIVDSAARYRGLENQLYRVEIHAPGLADSQGQGATFVWSRDNGSVVMAVLGAPAVDVAAGLTTVQLATLGRDPSLGLVVGGWVDLMDDASILRHDDSPLLRVHSIDRDTYTVVLGGVAQPLVGRDPALHPYLRRWDHDGQENAGGAVPVVESTADAVVWLDLEDGVQVAFQATAGGGSSDYRTGDYWLIPARTATGDVQWPVDGSLASLNPQPLPPAGELHAYASLSGVGDQPNGQGKLFTELRKFFSPLAS